MKKSMMKKLCIVVLMGALLLVSIGCGGSPSAQDATAPSETPAAATAEEATPAPVTLAAEESGTPELTDEDIARMEMEGEESSRLWLRIEDMERSASLMNSEVGDDGSRADTFLYDENVGVAIERLPSASLDDGIEEGIVQRISELSAVPVNAIDIEEDVGASTELTYPAYRLFYQTGEDENAIWNVDLYVLADTCDLHIRTMTPISVEEDYIEIIIGWFYSVELEVSDR